MYQEVRFDGHPDRDGDLKVVTNNWEYENGLGLPESRQLIPPPEGMPVSEWNRAVVQAALEVGERIGTGSPGEPNELESVEGRETVDFSAAFGRNCFSVRDEIMERAREIIGPLPGDPDFIGPLPCP